MKTLQGRLTNSGDELLSRNLMIISILLFLLGIFIFKMDKNLYTIIIGSVCIIISFLSAYVPFNLSKGNYAKLGLVVTIFLGIVLFLKKDVALLLIVIVIMLAWFFIINEYIRAFVTISTIYIASILYMGIIILLVDKLNLKIGYVHIYSILVTFMIFYRIIGCYINKKALEVMRLIGYRGNCDYTEDNLKENLNLIYIILFGTMNISGAVYIEPDMFNAINNATITGLALSSLDYKKLMKS